MPTREVRSSRQRSSWHLQLRALVQCSGDEVSFATPRLVWSMCIVHMLQFMSLQHMGLKHKITARLQYTPERFQGEKLQQM